MVIRTITLYQPFATLMVMGLKTNETRGRNTKVRGPLLIHSAAKTPTWCKELMKKPIFSRVLRGVELPTGSVLGQVEVVGTMPTDAWLKTMLDKKLQGAEFDRFQEELAFGNYEPNRFAWQTINPVQLEKPIPAKGSQGFWMFDMAGHINEMFKSYLNIPATL